MAIFVSTFSESVTITASLTAPNQPGGPDVVSGLAGSTGVTPEASSLPKPPYTNRGAQITIPPENRSIIDWVAFTLMVDDPYQVLPILDLSPSLFTEFSFGFSGYRKSLRFGNISVYYEGRDGMGCHVEMSGQGCRQYEGQFQENPWQGLFTTVLAAGGKFTRLDLAIDNVDGALSLERICAALQAQEVRTLFGEWRRIVKGGFREGERITGETIYLGSSKSHVMFRIYNKAQESGINGQWIRFEIQLREKRAQEAARLFAAQGDVGMLTTGIINNYFAIINVDDSNVSRCTLQSWWAAWLESTEKIRLATEKATKLVSDTMEFIKRQYAPSFAMINRHLGKKGFAEFVQETVDDGHNRMSAKHEQMLAASAAGSHRKGGSNGCER